MADETKTDLPTDWTNTEETSNKEVVDETTTDLKKTRKDIIKAYFDAWDKEKWFLVVSDLNISSNMYRGAQKKRLLASLDASKSTTTTDGWISIDTSKIEEKATTQISAKIEKTPLKNFRYEYDKSKMTDLKKLLSKPKADLEALKTQIDDGADLNVLLAGTLVVANTADTSTDKTTAPKTSSETIDDKKEYIYPVPDVKINSPYGNRIREGKEEFHPGVDIAAIEWTKILSVGEGTVEYAWLGSPTASFNGYGNYVVVKLTTGPDKGYRVLYGHMKSSDLKAGDSVKSWDKIGLMGSTGESTGSHLHLEIRKWELTDTVSTPPTAVEYFARKTVDPLSVVPVTKDMIDADVLVRVDHTLLKTDESANLKVAA